MNHTTDVVWSIVNLFNYWIKNYSKRVVSFMVAYLVFHPFVKLFHEKLWEDKVKFAENVILSQYKPHFVKVFIKICQLLYLPASCLVQRNTYNLNTKATLWSWDIVHLYYPWLRSWTDFLRRNRIPPKCNELVEEIHQFRRKGMTVIVLLFKIFSYQSNAWTTFLHIVVYQTT